MIEIRVGKQFFFRRKSQRKRDDDVGIGKFRFELDYAERVLFG